MKNQKKQKQKYKHKQSKTKNKKQQPQHQNEHLRSLTKLHDFRLGNHVKDLRMVCPRSLDSMRCIPNRRHIVSPRIPSYFLIPSREKCEQERWLSILLHLLLQEAKTVTTSPTKKKTKNSKHEKRRILVLKKGGLSFV